MSIAQVQIFRLFLQLKKCRIIVTKQRTYLLPDRMHVVKSENLSFLLEIVHDPSFRFVLSDVVRTQHRKKVGRFKPLAVPIGPGTWTITCGDLFPAIEAFGFTFFGRFLTCRVL